MLNIDKLAVRYRGADGNEVVAVRQVSLRVGPGECLGVVGESGSGKTQTFLAALGLLGPTACISGSVRFRGEELLGARARKLDRFRGSAATLVFQDPLTALTPHLSIGAQLSEPLRVHLALSAAAARARALELLKRVHINDAERRMGQYPHELSGGMRQRVVIAIALACKPELVIADEPTTALDVTIQAQIMRLLVELKRSEGMALVLITHDLGLIAGIADRLIVMQAGQIVEEGAVRTLLRSPQHPYTQALLDASAQLERVPRLRVPIRNKADAPLAVTQLAVEYQRRDLLGRRQALQALERLDLKIAPGEAVGIVGESGSGKSTLARAVLRLLEPSEGQIVWLGTEVSHLNAQALRPLRRDLQLVFQDPLAALDPRMTVEEILIEPLRLYRPEGGMPAWRNAVSDALHQVGLAGTLAARYPHELSGGQAQRVGIARAMIAKPRLLICDEAVSALDVSAQAHLLLLIEKLCREQGVALLFISHNLRVVRQLCDRVLVLYLGRLMETAPAASLFAQPAHPYTQSLLDAIPVADPEREPQRLASTLEGEVPSAAKPPSGCVFHTRCRYALELCQRERPPWESAGGARHVACHRWHEWPQLDAIDTAERPIQS